MILRQFVFNLVVAFSMVLLGWAVANNDSAGLGLVAVGGGLIFLTLLSFYVGKSKKQPDVAVCQQASLGDGSCR